MNVSAPADSVDEQAAPNGGPATGGPSDRGRRVVVVTSVVAIVVGAGLRLWVAFGPLGVLNADEVISALMARDLLDGRMTAFYWGQAYGGTIEVVPLAASIAVFGDRVGIVVVPLLEVVAIGWLLHAIARRHLDAAFALAVVALFAVAPAASVWFGTRPMGFYNPIIIFGLGAIVLAEQLRDPTRSVRSRLIRLAAIGVLLGIGWWTSAQILFFAVPVLYSLARHRMVQSWQQAGALVGGAVLGALIWLIYNLRNGMQSLTDLPPSDGSTIDHVRAQIERGWPMILGTRRPFDERWLLPGGGWLLLPIVVAAAIAVAVTFRRHPALRTPLAGVLLVFPVLQALAPTGSFVGNGRYYVFVVPALAYVIVATLSRTRHGAAAVTALVVTAAITTTLTLGSMRDLQFGPDDGTDLAAALDDRGIDHVYANYWIGYPLAWTDGDLRVATDNTDRRPDWAADVRAADRAAYVFWLPYGEDAQRLAQLEPLLRAVGIDEAFDVGEYRVLVPSRNVAPEQLGPTDPNG